MRRLVRLVSETSVAVCICCLGLRAEEQVSNELDTSEVTSSSQFISYARPAAALLNFASLSTNLTVQQLFPLPDEAWLAQSVPGMEARIDLRRDSSVLLFRTRIPSRHTYPVWAGLGTGYGRIFAPDTFGRTRTNGAGVVDPDWLYVKMNLRF
jgi:hypothetical protein